MSAVAGRCSGLRSFDMQMGYAFLAGLELSYKKAELQHGQFLPWFKEHLPKIPERTGRRYMAFAEAIQSKSATVADLTKAPLQLTNGKLSGKKKKAVLEAVYDLADGKSLTDFYRDLGVIRPPQKPHVSSNKQAAFRAVSSELQHIRGLPNTPSKPATTSICAAATGATSSIAPAPAPNGGRVAPSTNGSPLTSSSTGKPFATKTNASADQLGANSATNGSAGRMATPAPPLTVTPLAPPPSPPPASRAAGITATSWTTPL